MPHTSLLQRRPWHGMACGSAMPCMDADIPEEAVVASVPSPQCYNAVMEMVDSDHKPVYAQLDVLVPSYMQVVRRRSRRRRGGGC